MNPVLSFFRIFDLAFFAAGGVLFLALLPTLARMGLLPAGPVQLATAQGLLLVILVLGIVYVLGLVTHALQRASVRVWWRVRPREGAGGGGSWYRRLTPATREDLATYFWYLRATCWNLGAAALLAVPALGLSETFGRRFPLVALALVAAAALLVWLGSEYDGALHRASEPGAAPDAAPQAGRG